MAGGNEEKKSAQERSYSICRQVDLDLADSEAITALRDEFGKDSTVEVMVRVARVVKANPKQAINALGQKKDLEGAYAVFSDSSVNTFNVEVETTRQVRIS